MIGDIHVYMMFTTKAIRCMVVDWSPLGGDGWGECVFMLKLAEKYCWLTEEKVNIEPWFCPSSMRKKFYIQFNWP